MPFCGGLEGGRQGSLSNPVGKAGRRYPHRL